MFRCEVCSRVTAPGTPAQTVVVTTRPKQYASRPKAHPGYKDATVERKGSNGKPVVAEVRKRSRKPGDRVDDPGGEGTETVRTVTVCPECFKKLTEV